MKETESQRQSLPSESDALTLAFAVACQDAEARAVRGQNSRAAALRNILELREKMILERMSWAEIALTD